MLASVGIMSSSKVFLGCYVALLASMSTPWSTQPPPPPHARETLPLLQTEDMKAIQCVSSCPYSPHLCRNVPLGCLPLWEGPCPCEARRCHNRDKVWKLSSCQEATRAKWYLRMEKVHGASLLLCTVLKKKNSLWGDEQRLNEDCRIWF